MLWLVMEHAMSHFLDEWRRSSPTPYLASLGLNERTSWFLHCDLQCHLSKSINQKSSILVMDATKEVAFLTDVYEMNREISIEILPLYLGWHWKHRRWIGKTKYIDKLDWIKIFNHPITTHSTFLSKLNTSPTIVAYYLTISDTL